MNPNNPEHIADMGALLSYLGRPEEGLKWLTQAKRVDPYYGPAWYWHQVGLAHYTARRYDDAISALERSQTMPAWVTAYISACHAQAGRIAQAREYMSEALSLNPALSVKHFASREPFKDPADLGNLLDGLRKAGLPE